MENKFKLLLLELKEENEERNIKLKNVNISEYNHTVLVHSYNNTLNIIKRIESIIN